MTPKENILQHIAKGELEEALRKFLEVLPLRHSARDLLFLNSGRLNELNDRYQKGLLTQGEYSLERNKISYAILDSVNNWHPGGDNSPLENAVDKLPLPNDVPLGVLQMINCDRRSPLKRFRRVFNRKKDEKRRFQYYFFCGCPNQMPQSLAERILFEIILQEELSGNHVAVSYPFTEIGDFRRVNIEPLPIGTDLRSSQNKFKAYFQKHFKFPNLEDFDSFIKTGLPKLPYQFIYTAFEISEKEWKDGEGEMNEYFQWIHDVFQAAHDEVATFIFLFIVKMPGLHQQANLSNLQVKTMADLTAFCEKNDTALVAEINPIEPSDFEDWTADLGIKNPNDARAVLSALELALSETDRIYYLENKKLHMKYIEPVQEKIINHFRKKCSS